MPQAPRSVKQSLAGAGIGAGIAWWNGEDVWKGALVGGAAGALGAATFGVGAAILTGGGVSGAVATFTTAGGITVAQDGAGLITIVAASAGAGAADAVTALLAAEALDAAGWGDGSFDATLEEVIEQGLLGAVLGALTGAATECLSPAARRLLEQILERARGNPELLDALRRAGIDVIEHEGAMQLRFPVKGGEADIIAMVSVEDGVLWLREAGIAGDATMPELRALAERLRGLLGLRRISVESGVRTTGANPGRVPRTIHFPRE